MTDVNVAIFSEEAHNTAILETIPEIFGNNVFFMPVLKTACMYVIICNNVY